MNLGKKYILLMDHIHKDSIKKFRNIFHLINETDLKVKHYKFIQAVVLDIRKINFSYFDKFKNLKLIARFGVGYDNVDLDYLNKKKLSLAITNKSVINPVAEHTISLIFSILKKIKKFDNFSRKEFWKKKKIDYRPNDLYKKKVLIIGYGNIGKRVAKFLSVYNCEIKIYDPYVKSSKYKNQRNLKKALQHSDIVSLHLPFSKKTHKFFNKKLFDCMQPNSIFINTSRGKIVDENALINKLKKNKNFFAGIDVFYNEPISKKNSLIKQENILMTPHISTSSEFTRYEMSNEVLSNIRNFFKNKVSSKNFLKKNLL